MTETVTALATLISSIIIAGGAAYAGIRRERSNVAVVDRAQMRVTEEAWNWAVRTIRRMQVFIAAKDLDEPPEWNIDQTIARFERRMFGESEEDRRDR